MRSALKNILPFFVILFSSRPALSFIQQDDVHTDGVYQSKVHQTGNEHMPYFYHYLRFFPNGKVISVSSPSTPEEMKKWFVDTSKNVSKGIYKVNGNHVDFQCNSQQGTVDYKGTILANRLKLYSHSYINNSDSTEEFLFVHD